MFRQLIELGVVEVDTEPLDARIERRLKESWENTSCPRCGHQSMVTWDEVDRIWCRDYNFNPVFTYGTPFHEKHLSCGEVLLAFTLYADSLLSINQIAPFLGRAYRTVYTAIRDVEAAVQRGFPVVWSLLDQTIDGPTQVDESGKVCSGYKGQEPPRERLFRGGSSQTGRSRWRGRHGDQLTLVAACRDSLRVIRGQLGIDYSGDLEPGFRRLKTSPGRWERSGPTDFKRTERWSVTTEPSSTKSGTYRQTESTLTKLSACSRSSSHGYGSSAACPIGLGTGRSHLRHRSLTQLSW
ncbi:hypothetical protein C463_17228 [Halorubrum californiense DSM 19288]|uniref:ISXO2-like transposase domain-containing protein n=1 Tax=Halorubrum californiense DSM 19288 TaxID=1227465 RepID=M0DWV3_9EURY|nr:hypothetical protein C463_17228 [Halorubrum californiense DSM 19288]